MTSQEILEKIDDLQQQISELKVMYEKKSKESSPDNPEDVFNHVWACMEKWFKFDKVCTMMNAVEWGWAGVDSPLSVEDIKKFCKRQIRYCIENKVTTQCGGFEFVYRNAKESAELDGFDPELAIWPTVEMKFVGESCISDFDNEYE